MKGIVIISLAILSSAYAGLKEVAMDFVPSGWVADTAGAVIADFNADGADDIALVYYRIDPERGELSNRVNRVLILLEHEQGLKRVLDQGLPFDEDFGTEVMLSWDDGILYIFQHMGFMHRFNEWGLEWDEDQGAFWERTSAWGGLLGLGSAGGFDAGTGIGYVEKIWGDVDVSAEYSTIYAEKLDGSISFDGEDDEADWNRPWAADSTWVTFGENKWDGGDDASITVRALYDSHYLYLFVEVTDDEFVQPANADEILKSDHLELWFDRLTVGESEAQDYYPELWNRRKDPYVTQIAVAQTLDGKSVVRMWLPEDADYEPDIKSGFYREGNRWSAELGIAWVRFGTEGSMDHLPFTLVFSDSDNPSDPKQETLIGTSQLQWADPFTFGSLSTKKPDRIFWGVYPLPEEK
ncbi:hypothetical protein ES703_92396 [subsurface metagenome]|nr:hypothetical protein [bacterium]